MYIKALTVFKEILFPRGSIPPTPKALLPPGRYIQIYMDALRGKPDVKKEILKAALNRFKVLGIKGILWHLASYERITKMTPGAFQELALLCTERGLLCLGAFGLGSGSPELIGAHIGALASLPECDGVVFDMEGAWEDETSDKESARLLGEAFRKAAPTALAYDQPWPVPTVHWSKFPWEEIATFVDARAPQYYVNDWMKSKGTERYAFCWPWFKRSWDTLNVRLATKNLVRPTIVTIQGYKWVFKDLVNCLTSNPTIFIWAEPFPDEVFMAGLEVVLELESRGFTGPDAVRNFQIGACLFPDNVYGPATAAKLGLKAPPASH